jgi:prepilin-type N-terminal cleavage/methylation domain-containing protein
MKRITRRDLFLTASFLNRFLPKLSPVYTVSISHYCLFFLLGTQHYLCLDWRFGILKSSMWAIRKNLQNRAGFTIVELVIVIAIIGILATITVVAYNGVQDSAKISRAYTVVKNYQSALKLVALEYGLSSGSNACLGPVSAYTNNPGCGMGGQYANPVPSLNTYLANKGMTDQPLLPFSGDIGYIMYNGSYYGNNFNLIYNLPGEKVDCGVTPVISPNGSGVWGAHGAKYTLSNAGSGYTFCIVAIDP